MEGFPPHNVGYTDLDLLDDGGESLWDEAESRYGYQFETLLQQVENRGRNVEHDVDRLARSIFSSHGLGVMGGWESLHGWIGRSRMRDWRHAHASCTQHRATPHLSVRGTEACAEIAVRKRYHVRREGLTSIKNHVCKSRSPKEMNADLSDTIRTVDPAAQRCL